MADIPIKVDGFGGLVHDKYMIIDSGYDSARVITGSMDWTNAGDQENDENTIIIHDPITAQAFKDDFQNLYEVLGPWTLCPFNRSEIYIPLVSK